MTEHPSDHAPRRMYGGPFLTVRFDHRDTIRSVLAVDGELDVATAPLLVSAMSKVAAGGRRHLTVETGGLVFCDVAGARGLLAGQQRLTDHGLTMELANVPGAVRRTLDLTGLLDSFRLVPD
ncbi:STAS domain-containing protein [Spongiactinospora sp. 9N601]|uniref:STAS domain-containing protein n=1 Tax=Spongiactinospora sp. 9N601 TaxID=3375149 RepID=UPI0037BB35B4